jgi:hypothetical protein
MSDAVQTALIVAAAPVVLGIVNSILQYKARVKLEIIHKEFNGMKDQLIQTTKTEAHAAGVKEERDKQA